MRAVWYDRPGPAADVLRVGELPDPVPGPGEVRVRLARWGGATVIGTVRHRRDLPPTGVPTVALDQPDAAAAIRAHAPGGVDRIIEVAFAENIDLDATVAYRASTVDFGR